MRLRDPFLVCLYVALAAFPLIAMVLGVPDRKLAGSLEVARRPHLTIWKFKDEKFQPVFTKWFEQHLGFRNHAVVADNTALYHLFGETKPLARVVIGDDDVLFERDDISLLNKAAPSQAAVDALADKLAEVQRRMLAAGRAFVPVLVPSKTSFYRAAVPSAWWLRRVPAAKPASDAIYTMSQQALVARDVTFVDARALLSSSDAPPAQLWSPEGRHWSDYGACLVMHEVVNTYVAMLGRPLELPCRYEPGDLRWWHDDFDLLRLLNVWHPRSTTSHARVSYDSAPAGNKPRVMFIASSFGYQIQRVAEDSGRFSEAWLDYYDSTLHGWPTGVDLKIADLSSDQWRTTFLSQNLYVYELFETYLYTDDKLPRVLDKLLGVLPPAP